MNENSNPTIVGRGPPVGERERLQLMHPALTRLERGSRWSRQTDEPPRDQSSARGLVSNPVGFESAAWCKEPGCVSRFAEPHDRSAVEPVLEGNGLPRSTMQLPHAGRADHDPSEPLASSGRSGCRPVRRE